MDHHEDRNVNDHDVLGAGSVLALLVGKYDLTGEHRERLRGRGNPWPVPAPSTDWN